MQEDVSCKNNVEKVPENQENVESKWRTQKVFEGGPEFRHIRVTSQINFMGPARWRCG